MSETYHPDKGPLIRDLNPGDHFIGYYLLRYKQLEPFRDPSRGRFLTLIVGDSSGQLQARVWEDAEEADDQLHQGEVVKLDGEVETYLERRQIRVLRVRPAQAEEYDRRDMLPSSTRDPGEMQAELEGYLEQIEDPHLRALLESFYKDERFLTQLVEAPGAQRIHHAYLGGLLEHTLEVLNLAEAVIAIYPQMDADLLRAGVLLHDIGKLREYRWDLDIEFTDEGRLLGHVVMSDEMVHDAIQGLPDFPEELALRLRHMLLAHHGRHEWGSPRRPKTLEAIALHHIENLSAQINRFLLLIEGRPPGEKWSGYDRRLGRRLYAGEDDLSIEERSRQE